MELLKVSFIYLLFSTTFQATAGWTEEIFAQISVGIFISCVIGFLFSVLVGCFLQIFRAAMKTAGKDEESSNERPDPRPASISQSLALHTDGKHSRLVRLDQLKQTDVTNKESRGTNKRDEASSRDIRESLYATIDVTRKTHLSGLDPETYPPVDYR